METEPKTARVRRVVIDARFARTIDPGYSGGLFFPGVVQNGSRVTYDLLSAEERGALRTALQMFATDVDRQARARIAQLDGYDAAEERAARGCSS